jgi:HSP20 family protein
MKRRMDMLYSERFTESEASGTETEPETDIARWEPFVDILESDEEWIVVADLPGVAEDDIQVELIENQLIITGRREAVARGKKLTVSKAERPEGLFSRAFILPCNALREKIHAESKRGVLTVTIPKGHLVQGSHHKIVVHSE